MLTITETTVADIQRVQRLWADGDVMRFVGFPDGLHQTNEEMQEWFRWIDENRPAINHYSIFEDGVYCGETFYKIDKDHQNRAAMDIKLFSFARGRGIASKALSYAVREAFRHGARIVWVDPDPRNVKAIALYERLGFKRAEMPAYLAADNEAASIYMQLRKEDAAPLPFDDPRSANP